MEPPFMESPYDSPCISIYENIYENPHMFFKESRGSLKTPLRSVLTALRPQDLAAVEQVGQPYFWTGQAGHRAGQKQTSMGMVDIPPIHGDLGDCL